jgi:Right handed beta helix region
MKGSSRNTIEGNTFTSDPIQLTSGSQRNILRNNTIIGQRIRFEGASNNEVYNMSVQEQGGRPSNAYEFNQSSGNTIVDSEAIDPVDYHIRAANTSKNNAFTRFLAGPSLWCFVDGTSKVTVTDPNGNPLGCGSK